MLVKFEQNRMVQATLNFFSFLTLKKNQQQQGWNKQTNKQTNKQKQKQKQKQNVFLIHFWQSVDAILEDVSVAETIV